MSRHATPPDAPIGYVLKGYPRISELFIASEIYRLEQLGLPLQIYVLKPADERTTHPVVDRISAPVSYAPATDSLSRSGLPSWLYRNGGAFVAPMLRQALRHPVRMLRTVSHAARQSWRARRGARPRKIYVKEFLQACWLADTVRRGGGVRRLHAHFAHGTTTVTWLAATLLDVPFSFTGHAKDLYLESLNPAGLLARKMKAATAVVTCTGANVDHLRSLAPDVPVTLAYHGLNAEFSSLIAQAPPATEPVRARLVSVGRLVRKKGFDVLIEAVALLRDRNVHLDVVIAGEEGSEANAVRRLVSSLGLDASVTFLGPLSQARLLGEYRRSTLFALACRVGDDGDRDGIPNVLVEAMAAGLPVVSTTISGIPELVTDEETGLLVPPEDPHALADAIGRLAADAALRQRLATAAEKRVAEDFDGSVLAGRLAELLVAR
jgi:glycosyltransferase involved in cell wall biosynthesis